MKELLGQDTETVITIFVCSRGGSNIEHVSIDMKDKKTS